MKSTRKIAKANRSWPKILNHCFQNRAADRCWSLAHTHVQQQVNLSLTYVFKKSIKRRESKSVLDPAAAASTEAADPIEAAPVPVKREKSRVIKPLSEVAKTVAYIRQYIRPSDREDDQTLRNTSWSQHN